VAAQRTALELLRGAMETGLFEIQADHLGFGPMSSGRYCFARSTRQSKQLLGTLGQRPAEFAGCLISLPMRANISRGCRQ